MAKQMDSGVNGNEEQMDSVRAVANERDELRKRVQELEGALRASIEQMKRDRHNLRESAEKLQLHDRLLLNAIVADLDEVIAEAESLLSKEQL